MEQTSDNQNTQIINSAAYSPALMRVSGQLSVTEKLLAKVDDLLLLPYRKGDKWGFCDKNGIIKISCNYDAVGYFGENKLATFKEWDYWGLLDKTGQVIVPAFYEKIGRFSEGLCVVLNQKRLAGFLDKEGRIVIKCQFSVWNDDIENINFHEGLVKIDDQNATGLYGFMNRNGETVIPFKYSSAGYFSDGFAPVSEYIQVDEFNYEYVYGYIDQKGEYLDDGFSSAEEFSEGWAVVSDHSYFSIDGKMLSRFDVVNTFKEQGFLIKNL